MVYEEVIQWASAAMSLPEDGKTCLIKSAGGSIFEGYLQDGKWFVYGAGPGPMTLAHKPKFWAGMPAGPPKETA